MGNYVKVDEESQQYKGDFRQIVRRLLLVTISSQ